MCRDQERFPALGCELGRRSPEAPERPVITSCRNERRAPRAPLAPSSLLSPPSSIDTPVSVHIRMCESRGSELRVAHHCHSQAAVKLLHLRLLWQPHARKRICASDLARGTHARQQRSLESMHTVLSKVWEHRRISTPTYNTLHPSRRYK